MVGSVALLALTVVVSIGSSVLLQASVGRSSASVTEGTWARIVGMVAAARRRGGGGVKGTAGASRLRGRAGVCPKGQVSRR